MLTATLSGRATRTRSATKARPSRPEVEDGLGVDSRRQDHEEGPEQQVHQDLAEGGRPLDDLPLAVGHHDSHHDRGHEACVLADLAREGDRGQHQREGGARLQRGVEAAVPAGGA